MSGFTTKTFDEAARRAFETRRKHELSVEAMLAIAHAKREAGCTGRIDVELLFEDGYLKQFVCTETTVYGRRRRRAAADDALHAKLLRDCEATIGVLCDRKAKNRVWGKSVLTLLVVEGLVLKVRVRDAVSVVDRPRDQLPASLRE